MSAAFKALPELLGGPGIVGSWIAKLHLAAAPLAANLNLHVVHARILQPRGYTWPAAPLRRLGLYIYRMGIIIPGLVLCAGRSRRMGQPKALLPTADDGETFVGRIVRVLREGGIDDVVIVVGPESPPLETALRHENLPPRVVVNPVPARGQLSTLLVGLMAVDRPGVSGVLVTLVDVPLVDAATVRRLKAEYGRTRAPIVRPVRNGRHGHPVIFDRAVFDELRRADAATGAKTVVHAHLAEAVDVPVTIDGPFVDVDTPADYQRVFGKQPPRASDSGFG